MVLDPSPPPLLTRIHKTKTGPKRIKHTLMPLVFRAIMLARRIKKQVCMCVYMNVYIYTCTVSHDSIACVTRLLHMHIIFPPISLSLADRVTHVSVTRRITKKCDCLEKNDGKMTGNGLSCLLVYHFFFVMRQAWYSRVLQCVAVCCSVLQCGAVWCSAGRWYRVARTHRMPYIYRSFPAKEAFISWLFCGNRPATYKVSLASSPPCAYITLDKKPLQVIFFKRAL